MRGKGTKKGSLKDFKGITPAYAGKSSILGKAGGIIWDHPRVCGEKFMNLMNEQREKGSPPRMRGKAQFNQPNTGRLWITPAYAGKRTALHDQRITSWDHPRVCGEKLICSF